MRATIFVYICVYIHIHICVYIYTHTHIYDRHTHTHIYIYMCVCVCVIGAGYFFQGMSKFSIEFASDGQHSAELMIFKIRRHKIIKQNCF